VLFLGNSVEKDGKKQDNMLEVLNIIKEKQQEAKKIISDASIEAEKIKQGLLQKSVAENEKAFLAEIAQAEKKADELHKSSSLGIDQEIKQILSTAEQQAKEIEIKAKINHEKAVNDVLDMILNRSEKK
jgi:vacuolar-type H+-ATPase subunit H